MLVFYLAPLRDVQSPVKGQGDHMSGSEEGLQCRNNGTCWELFLQTEGQNQRVITCSTNHQRAKDVCVPEYKLISVNVLLNIADETSDIYLMPMVVRENSL